MADNWSDKKELPAYDNSAKADALNPIHYRYFSFGIETHDVISDVLNRAGLTPEQSFDAGNLIKYVRRAGLKGDEVDYVKDVYKAANYLHRLVFGEWLEVENG